MRTGPFLPADLDGLGALYERASAVLPMEDIFDIEYQNKPTDIGLRHDCDNVIHPAMSMARWEWKHGYRATYYILHTSPYWQDKELLKRATHAIADLGHEIGIHNDAITVALETGRAPADILHEAIDELRGMGHTIRSTVAHGNRLCHIAKYVNDEMFVGCSRPTYGNPDRTLEHEGRRVALEPAPLSSFGLDFDANWLPRGDYLSDSGGRWSQPFDDVAAAWPSKGQLHILQHPDWWTECWERAAA